MLEPMTRGSSLREQAALAIRGGIITGEIQPGEIYSAPALAERLGVSATPVREAMLDLASEGLVEAVRNRGFRVVPLTERDLDEIFEMRMLLEVPAVVALVQKPGAIDDRAMKRLRAMADEIAEHAEAGDLAAFIDADRLFHITLLERFGNRRLVETVERLRNSTRRYGLPGLDRDLLVAFAREHHRILDALVQGDEDQVRVVMEEHLAPNRGALAGRQTAAPRR